MKEKNIDQIGAQKPAEGSALSRAHCRAVRHRVERNNMSKGKIQM